MLDQDWTTLNTMRTLSNVYQAVTRMSNAKGKDIHSLTTEERRIIRWLRDEKLW